MKGTVKLVTKNEPGKLNSEEKCADVCYAIRKCLVWEYDTKKKKCKTTVYQGNTYCFLLKFTYSWGHSFSFGVYSLRKKSFNLHCIVQL